MLTATLLVIPGEEQILRFARDDKPRRQAGKL